MSETRFVPPAVRREAPPLPTEASVHYDIDVVPTATQQVIMRSDHIKTALGHLIDTVPFYLTVAGATVGVCRVAVGMPVLSVWAIVIFVIVFGAGWGFSLSWKFQHSPEGISLYEAKRKWDLMEADNKTRWEYYEKLLERMDR